MVFPLDSVGSASAADSCIFLTPTHPPAKVDWVDEPDAGFTDFSYLLFAFGMNLSHICHAGVKREFLARGERIALAYRALLRPLR
jgi:hypothetical protein